MKRRARVRWIHDLACWSVICYGRNGAATGAVHAHTWPQAMQLANRWVGR